MLILIMKNDDAIWDVWEEANKSSYSSTAIHRKTDWSSFISKDWVVSVFYVSDCLHKDYSIRTNLT